MPPPKLDIPPVGAYLQYQGKLKDHEIARILGVSRSTLIRWKQEWGIKYHHQRDKLIPLIDREDEYWKLSARGLYDYEIARRFKVHPQSMSRLKRMWREHKVKNKRN